ncbi:hypothetical protein [Microbacterium sp. LWH10-1.2]|uniref:hypothetical protein n=1 Tax=Microbacterium sp. LWH10-1.2 TaxID=3135255 RepID=UPI0031397977
MDKDTPTPPRHVALGELRDIPARMSLPTAGRLIAGLSRARSYELHRLGEFPAPVQQIGARFYVRGSDVLRALGFDPEVVLLGVRTSTNTESVRGG